jgi:hypothetical protein
MASIYSLLFGPVLSSSTSYGSKWQSDLNSGIFTFLPDPGNRSYRVIFDYSFPDNWYMGEESGITYFSARKTGLYIPFWLANRLSDWLEYWETDKRPVLGVPVF